MFRYQLLAVRYVLTRLPRATAENMAALDRERAETLLIARLNDLVAVARLRGR